MAEQNGYIDFLREKKKIYLIALIVFLSISASFWWWRVYIYPYESTDDANIDGVEVSVSSEYGGRILRLLVDEGDHIKKGELLFVIDDQLLQAELGKARAAINNANDQVKLQKIKVDLATLDYQRAKLEFDQSVISLEMMEHVQKALEAEKAAFMGIVSMVALHDSQLKLIEAQAQKCQVTAPCDGVIAKRWHFPGDVVREGQAVFSLFDLANIWITANLEETKIAHVHYNDLVRIRVDAYPNLNFSGNVLTIGAGASSQFSLLPPNNATGNFTKVTQRVPIRISLTPPYSGDTLYLRPGMSVEIKIKTR